MDDSLQLERRCHRIAEDVALDRGNEVALLRDARVLKSVHGRLTLALRHWIRDSGRSEATAEVEASLTAMEQDLRRVLLEYPSLRESQLFDHLMRAVTGSLETLDLLENAMVPVSV
ncbi:MAG: hypothetical protein PVSMB7_25610 [Chloroflexota bacterium]